MKNQISVQEFREFVNNPVTPKKKLKTTVCKNIDLKRSIPINRHLPNEAKKVARTPLSVSVAGKLKATTTRAKPKYEESRIQIECLRWFKYAFPLYKSCIFAIPNEGKRTPQAGKRDKDMGVISGVSDLFLMQARQGYYGLFLECKAPKGVLSENQKDFGLRAVNNNYSYHAFRSFDQFKLIVENYML